MTGTTTGATTGAPVRFNPFSAEFQRDPYPLYQQLRETRPVHRTMGMWVLTRHADIAGVLRDRTFSAGLIPRLITRQADRLGHDDVGRIERLARKSLVFTDNPDHGRLRALVNPVFTARTVAGLRHRIEAAAERLVARAWEEGGMDAVADFAATLPVTVMADWMALPRDIRDQVGSWTHDVRFLLEPGLMTAADLTHVCEVVETFALALGDVAAERRVRPGDDLISALLAARTGAGDALSDEELIFVCIMCFVAGNETTTALIDNGLLALLSNPDQDALLHDRPELVAGAVAEALRYDSPLQLTKRLATRDTDVGGEQVRAGDQVLLCLGAANRDPAVFDRPDRFDITRHAPESLALGHGMHGCLGGILATMQAQVALERIYARVEHLARCDEHVEWQDHSFIVRGPKHLPVTVTR